jgi:outer membrane protein
MPAASGLCRIDRSGALVKHHESFSVRPPAADVWSDSLGDNMNFLARTRGGTATLLAFGAMLGGANLAHAQSPALDTIFSQVTPSMRDRLFMRLNYIHVNVKTSSDETRDVTGPVVGINDIRNFLGFRDTNSDGVHDGYQSLYSTNINYARKYFGNASSVQVALQNALNSSSATCARYADGLGTPCGVGAKSQTVVGTPALSMGYFIDDAYTWSIEAFLLAAPLNVEVSGDGPNTLNGQAILKTKLLPPTAYLARHFGKRGDALRPYVGLAASYAIFYDTRATSLLNGYVGGATSVSIKNSFGFGPMMGVRYDINDDWHLNFGIGKIRYKTEATLVTRETVITDDSAVLQDYGADIFNAIQNAALAVGPRSNAAGGPGPVAPANDPAGFAAGTNLTTLAPTTTIMCDLATAKARANNPAAPATCNQGSFTRKQSTKLDNTLFVFSVGRSF